jgi:hypothetical protein
MKRNGVFTVMLTGGIAAMGALGLTLVRLTPPAQAAPIVKPAAAAASPLGDMFSGKTFPLTVSIEQMNAGYHLVALVDAQGKANLYATRGETTAAGGETYLVAYEVTLTDPKEGPPEPKPGTIGQIIFIDLHAVQAMGGIATIQPAPPAPIIAPATP